MLNNSYVQAPFFVLVQNESFPIVTKILVVKEVRVLILVFFTLGTGAKLQKITDIPYGLSVIFIVY